MLMFGVFIVDDDSKKREKSQKTDVFGFVRYSFHAEKSVVPTLVKKSPLKKYPCEMITKTKI